MKGTVLILAVTVAALALVACNFPETQAYLEEIGEFRVLRDDYVYADSDSYQVGFIVYASGYADISVNNGAAINGSPSSVITGDGEVWGVIDLSEVVSGDVVEVYSEYVDRKYYNSEGPEVKTKTLFIEVR